jgi:hypothetical protein
MKTTTSVSSILLYAEAVALFLIDIAYFFQSEESGEAIS